MKTVLQHWNVSWLKVILTENGQFSLWKGLLSKSRPQGQAFRVDGAWFALYAKDGSLRFRKNSEEWTVSEDLQCAYERSSDHSRCFILKLQGREVLRHRYRAVASRGLRQLDPTYDQTDEELEDFFLWAARLLNDRSWQANMLKAWTVAP
ncbi:hypothetical protein [Oligoflexus tunisiensis]|uniref:hypothetical protein n=1 Tax=Oligoflexus tunisiensis TaxID=708132 RepID=UPI00114CFD7C|nr:hypothetical protein [Oligoflexus tunisiensis]